jgi:hypothetical protein
VVFISYPSTQECLLRKKKKRKKKKRKKKKDMMYDLYDKDIRIPNNVHIISFLIPGHREKKQQCPK